MDQKGFCQRTARHAAASDANLRLAPPRKGNCGGSNATNKRKHHANLISTIFNGKPPK